MTASQRFCTFELDGRLYGLEVERVQEILGRHEISPLPLAQPTVAGLIHLRGQVVTALDLRRCLRLPERPHGVAPVHVVATTPNGLVSLLVDAASEVLEVPNAAFAPTPGSLGGPARRLIRGAYELDGRLLIALDLDRIVELTHAPQGV